jgi:hypothetical protein
MPLRWPSAFGFNPKPGSLKYRFYKTISKAFSTIRDNSIYYVLSEHGFKQSAAIFQWATTNTSDIAIFAIASKLGITSIQSKYLILLIVTFLV